MTNYEKLKSMSIEEMARELCQKLGICDGCPSQWRCYDEGGLFLGICVKEWLESEVETE